MAFTEYDVDAKDLAQALLERAGSGLMEDDFDLHVSCFHLPYIFSTFEGDRVLEDKDAFRTVFDDAREALLRECITTNIRTCESAMRASPEIIKAMHVSHYFSGNTRCFEPLNVLSAIEFRGGEWRFAQSDYAVEPDTTLARALTGQLHIRQSNVVRLTRR